MEFHFHSSRSPPVDPDPARTVTPQMPCGVVCFLCVRAPPPLDCDLLDTVSES